MYSSVFRQKARSALKQHWQTALLIALIVSLPTLLVQGITVFTGNDVADRLQAIIVAANRDGVMTEQYLAEEIRAFLSSTGFWTARGLELAAWLVTPSLTLGLYKWLMDRLRGKEQPVSAVFCRLKLFLKAIGLQLLVVLKVLAWMLPGIAAGAAVMVPMYRASDAQEQLAAFRTVTGAFFPVLLLMIIPGVMAALRYALSEYVLADEPGTKITACIRRSRELMQDRKKALFSLMVSFLGWYLLEMLGFSFLEGMGSGVLAMLFQMVAGLALQVYMSCAVAAFYLEISGVDTVPRPAEPDGDAAAQG